MVRLMMKPVAIVAWTGLGRFKDIHAAAAHKMAVPGEELHRSADALVVPGQDPVAVARRLASMPGVSWIAVGYEFTGMDGFLRVLGRLSKRYLNQETGRTFRITAQIASGAEFTAGDFVLGGTSEIISAVPGAHLSEKKEPDVRFRVTASGQVGACGVEIRAGPGGAPTRPGARINLLVSGGRHSSATAWMAALSGFALNLVHARGSGDEALRRVALLYSELSRRMDATHLNLTVLTGANGAVRDRIARTITPTVAGWHPECRESEARPVLAGEGLGIMLPLFLVQEDQVNEMARTLGLEERAGAAPAGFLEGLSAAKRVPAELGVLEFSGREPDPNAVLDSLLRQEGTN